MIRAIVTLLVLGFMGMVVLSLLFGLLVPLLAVALGVSLSGFWGGARKLEGGSVSLPGCVARLRRGVYRPAAARNLRTTPPKTRPELPSSRYSSIDSSTSITGMSSSTM